MGVNCDEFFFDFSEVFAEVVVHSPTMRLVVGVVIQFYDPIGLLSPVIIVFKVFLQELTKAGMNWDEPLADSFLERWKILVWRVYSEVHPFGFTCMIGEHQTHTISAGSAMPLTQHTLLLFTWLLLRVSCVKPGL